jgi:hypothetical protein
MVFECKKKDWAWKIPKEAEMPIRTASPLTEPVKPPVLWRTISQAQREKNLLIAN